MNELTATALTTEIDGITHIRGYSLLSLLEKATFSDSIFLLLRGNLPSVTESRAFAAILVSAIDHGSETPSSDVARRVIAAGSPLQAGIAAGILAIAERHGGAIESAGKLLQEAARVGPDADLNTKAEHLIANGQERYGKVPGFGHRVYKTDPRTTALFSYCENLGVAQDFFSLARSAESVLEQKRGRKLCLNIDGAMAAALSALGFQWNTFKGVFILARTPGLVAQALEEKERGTTVIRTVENRPYDGPQQRKL